MQYQLIDNPQQLTDWLAQLKQFEWVAMDTEFVHENTYYAQLCLVQISTPTGQIACIDTKKIPDSTDLIELMLDPSICKVMHAGSQDMQIFFNLCGQLPQNIFDTQVAAPLLGYQEQISYSNLVGIFCGISLAKDQTQTDWNIRPLSAKQLEYAAKDVLYLSQLYPEMRQRLIEIDRLSWLDEGMSKLLSTRRYQRAPEDAWERVRGVRRLKGASLRIAKALAHWRELRAKEKDLPSRWVLKDYLLLAIAKQQPTSLPDLCQIRGLDNAMANTLWPVCAEAQSAPPEEPPPAAPRVPSAPTDSALVDVLGALIKLQATRGKIAHSLLGSRKEIIKLSLGQDSTLSTGWRQEMLQGIVQRFMSGEICITAADNALVLRDVETRLPIEQPDCSHLASDVETEVVADS